ncbi:hypothetical protein [Nostoc sp.]|uniref:hypothetical protein n=1 Tax=Nostoc sp. TaxID=1180 RepID=UPI002FF80893
MNGIIAVVSGCGQFLWLVEMIKKAIAAEEKNTLIASICVLALSAIELTQIQKSSIKALLAVIVPSRVLSIEKYKHYIQ